MFFKYHSRFIYIYRQLICSYKVKFIFQNLELQNFFLFDHCTSLMKKIVWFPFLETKDHLGISDKNSFDFSPEVFTEVVKLAVNVFAI